MFGLKLFPEIAVKSHLGATAVRVGKRRRDQFVGFGAGGSCPPAASELDDRGATRFALLPRTPLSPSSRVPPAGSASGDQKDTPSREPGVEGLTYLLTESAKLMISETDFQDSVHVLGFSDELNKLLLQLYLDNRKEIRSILSELAPKLPSYHNLEWRLDVQLASRSLRQQIKPAVTLKLHLNQNGDQTAQVLQTDPSTLLHLIQQLERALGEMKTNHCRRIVRNMK
nr:PREDICTED: COMM domain-containing protein 2 [Struthio camelus australis]